ncbi:MAG TPA: TMEM165/GDT1 family protein [Mycobacteriales bacterium]
MQPLLIPLVFVVVLVAELPDKSMFASLVLGTRFRPRWVFLGVATAFLVHVILAVVAGHLLSLLPHRALEVLIATLFAAGAAYMWISASKSSDEETAQEHLDSAASGSALAAFATSFGVVFIGEWGDITQILTANLTARYDDPLAVAIGATLGLWTAALLAITAGRALLRYISVALLQRLGALILLGFTAYSILQIITS